MILIASSCWRRQIIHPFNNYTSSFSTTFEYYYKKEIFGIRFAYRILLITKLNCEPHNGLAEQLHFPLDWLIESQSLAPSPSLSHQHLYGVQTRRKFKRLNDRKVHSNSF